MAKSKTSFKPGQCGNPNGRPRKEISIPHILREIGQEPATGDPNGITKIEAVCKMVFSSAVKGHSWAVQFIADRTEGKPIQTVITNDSNKLETMTDAELRKEIRDLESSLGITSRGRKKATRKKGAVKPS